MDFIVNCPPVRKMWSDTQRHYTHSQQRPCGCGLFDGKPRQTPDRTIEHTLDDTHTDTHAQTQVSKHLLARCWIRSNPQMLIQTSRCPCSLLLHPSSVCEHQWHWWNGSLHTCSYTDIWPCTLSSCPNRILVECMAEVGVGFVKLECHGSLFCPQELHPWSETAPKPPWKQIDWPQIQTSRFCLEQIWPNQCAVELFINFV